MKKKNEIMNIFLPVFDNYNSINEILITKFIYNNVKNEDISYLYFKMNFVYNQYFYFLKKKQICNKNFDYQIICKKNIKKIDNNFGIKSILCL